MKITTAQYRKALQASEAKRKAAKKPARPVKAGKAKTDPTLLFFTLCQAQLGSQPTPEYKFHDTRRWRFDYAWTAERVALEVEGGVWTGGRHTRGKGFLGDMEKYNAASSAGWVVLRCVPKDLCAPGTLDLLRKALARARQASRPDT